MNYQVLARKWRPHNFTEVVGQEHVVKSLTNALHHNRLHHAYLFTGTRGVGKTTLARILAKAINCENLQDFNPCGVCPVCREVDEGRFLDLIEVDAASRTKVEDTRDLLDNAQYAPNHGRYKIYLIDEVHMLSGHSFNALLKTLEEPPPHVKFLLATTDPQKIPVTVLSRCLQFNLKRLLPEQILSQMSFILEQENIAFDTPALKLLARAADGSMRDGLSLLDQAIVFGAGNVIIDDVRMMLGTIAQQPVAEILLALAKNDVRGILDTIKEIAGLTTDFGEVLTQMLQILHRIALVQQLPDSIGQDFDNEMIAELVAMFNPEDVQLYYQIGLLGQRDLELAPDQRSGFEMVVLRMLAFRPVAIESVSSKSPPERVGINEGQYQEKAARNYQSANVVTLREAIKEKSPDQWVGMIAAMKIGGMTRELANNCVLESLDERICVLRLDPGHKHLLGSLSEDKLQKAIQAYCGKPVKLVFNNEKITADTPAIQLTKEREDKQQAAVDAINSDENVLALRERLDARILSGTIEPV
ncbi:MAG: DNA polymerase III subunit gamma/tau [Methylovulum sp.]|uniref:DNA polymerase III subunit gamma/tau n=1 Tax=Methylovulum sp. TaxID=1916980 RepID=UPI00261BE6A4|nr:DNA polymerase III subunit gamma/tau [Methylovulum sp.]MDD2723083.1 DNA polymerase III subunit gamma/tau [Methylovulum sp.]MDD5123549.1 DNA polymerase III subunit gamma/tau [Methylovulum sp.]